METAGACDVSMLKKVRDLFASQKPPPREITLDEVMVVLEEKEQSWREELERGISPCRQKFSEVSSALLVRAATLSESEGAGVYHPKLEKITRNSLPQFVRAISLSLNRPVSSDPRAFYLGATEMLRGCIKAIAGPGRYLGTAFPEEMKEIRGLVDELGHQVNEMTPLMAEDKKRSHFFTRAREFCRSVREGQTALAGAGESLNQLETRERELAIKRDELAREKDQCDLEVRKDRALQDALQEVGMLSDRVAGIEREIHAMLSTIVHVFSKAEKILQKRAGAEKEIKMAIALVSSEGNAVREETVDRIQRVTPLVVSMIKTGEIQLKNQGEVDLFSSPDSICPSLFSLVSRRKDAEKALREKAAFIQSHPARNRGSQAEKILVEITREIEETRVKIRETRAGMKSMEREITKKAGDLEETLRGILSGEIRLKI